MQVKFKNKGANSTTKRQTKKPQIHLS